MDHLDPPHAHRINVAHRNLVIFPILSQGVDYWVAETINRKSFPEMPSIELPGPTHEWWWK